MNDTTEYQPEGTCPSCHEGNLEEDKRDFTTQTGDGRELLVKNLKARTCNKCGESIFPRESLDQIEAALVKAMGTLTPEQVEKFVSMTGLREDELCECLGLGAKTIYRWRRGAQRPSKSLSILLGIVAHNPQVLDWVKSDAWRQSGDSSERFFAELDNFWGNSQALAQRFPHSRGQTASLDIQEDQDQKASPARFNPAMGLCLAEVE
jgi:putative zinc finger/helix-turn-helix YgiT family protein